MNIHTYKCNDDTDALNSCPFWHILAVPNPRKTDTVLWVRPAEKKR